MFVRAGVGLLVGLSVVCAQNVISTVAGTEAPLRDVAASEAPLGFVADVRVDRHGNVYASDYQNNVIVKIAPDGRLSVFAGNGLSGYTGDGGPATGASLNIPAAMAVDRADNLFFISRPFVVRVIRSDGTIETVAGGGATRGGDGMAGTQVSLNNPQGIAVDNDGAVLIADTFNSRILRVGTDGTVRTIMQSLASSPTSPAVLPDGGIYFVSRNQVQRLNPDGSFQPVAGTTGVSFLTAGLDGKLYFVAQRRIACIDTGDRITYLTEATPNGFSGDGGLVAQAQFNGIAGIAVDERGAIYVADTQNLRVRRITPDGIVSTIAGNGRYRFNGDGGRATSASFNEPSSGTIGPDGSLYITDRGNHRIRRVRPDGTVTTIAGTGQGGFAGDGGPAIAARLNRPSQVSLDPAGNLYIHDYLNTVIRRIAPDGLISTLPVRSLTAGGAARTFISMAHDAAGRLYLAEFDRVYRFTPGGEKVLVAGTGRAGYTGDGGPAVEADIDPRGIGVAPDGTLYIAAVARPGTAIVIRRVNLQGVIETVAGNGQLGFCGDGGPAKQACFASSTTNIRLGVAMDGTVYIPDGGNQRVRRLLPNGFLDTFAGGAPPSNAVGDGRASTEAVLHTPTDVFFDTAGNVYIADTGNHRIRKVSSVAATTLQAQPSDLSFTGTARGRLLAAKSVSITPTVAGFPFTATVSEPWIRISPESGEAPGSIEVSVNPGDLNAGAYEGTISIAGPGVPTLQIRVKVTLTAAPARPVLRVRPIVFEAQGDADVKSTTFSVENEGGGAVAYTANASASWLTISPSSGTATAERAATVTLMANPMGLADGTYRGLITVVAIGANGVINADQVTVDLIVKRPRRVLLLSQAGLTFTSAARGGRPLPQSFGVLNTGAGRLDWTAEARTLSGGDWLRIGSSLTAAAAGIVATPLTDVSLLPVAINSAELPAGEYYGTIRVSAPGADNSPQTVAVVLKVLPEGTPLPPEISPSGIIFLGSSDRNPGSQEVMIANPKQTSIGFTSLPLTTDRRRWLSNLPTDAVTEPSAPTRMIIQPDFSLLEPGKAYTGTVNLLFDDGTPAAVRVLAVVAPEPARMAKGRNFASDTCDATKLQLQVTSPTDMTIDRGQPVSLQARVVDNCARPVNNTSNPGSIEWTFSDGAKGTSPVHTRDGNWVTTYQTRSTPGNTITATVTAFVHLRGSTFFADQKTVTLRVRSNLGVPRLDDGGVRNGASLLGERPIAPGTVVTILGEELADIERTADGTPLPNELGGTEIRMADRPLPLSFARGTQINAQIPFDLPPDSQHQIVVRRGGVVSVPEQITVAKASPAIFTASQDGKGQGEIYFEGTNDRADAAKPAAVGDRISIYCAGLGTVQTTIQAGVAAPLTPPRTTSTPRVLIGGQQAEVLASTLAPGSIGGYRVTVVVPNGITPGPAVPVTLEMEGQTSPPVTIAIR